uniref:Ig-like domain-containing protein n=1 Tax=Strigops habroptila TaxID=2489341 RepID=A0A672VB18_STRHB
MLPFLSRFCANVLLTQTPERIVAQAGNETELLCELQREHAGVYWYRWSQEKQNFEFLMFFSPLGKATYGTNISQEKFSVHGTSSRTSYSLHISHLNASDNGIYYCSISQSSQLLLGTGTRLTVGKVPNFLGCFCCKYTLHLEMSEKPHLDSCWIKEKPVSDKGELFFFNWARISVTIKDTLIKTQTTAGALGGSGFAGYFLFLLLVLLIKQIVFKFLFFKSIIM